MKNKVRTTYLLESVNLEERTGVFKMKPEFPKNGPWTTIEVALSGILCHRIKERMFDGLSRPQEFVGTKFTSTVDSPEFGENPFKLTKFIPTGNSDLPENYLLGLVIERYTPKEQLKDAFGNQIEVIRKWRRTQPKYFLRYIEQKTTAMKAGLAESVRIVSPKSE